MIAFKVPSEKISTTRWPFEGHNMLRDVLASHVSVEAFHRSKSGEETW